MYKPGGEPSRHAAPRSLECRTRLKRSDCASTICIVAKAAIKTIIKYHIMGETNYSFQMSSPKQQSKEKTKVDPTLSQISERQFGQVSLIGNYKYYNFHGCMLSEPMKHLATHGLFFMGLLFYFIFSAKYQHPVLITFTIILYLLYAVDMVFMAFIDPGIIPKILPNYENQQFKLDRMPIRPDYLKQAERDNKESSFIFVRKGYFLKMKFCNECCVYQPPRTRHCYCCDVCVQKFDHHCPWVGTCIAKNNYKFYYIFLFLSTTLSLTIFGQSIHGIVTAAKSGQVVYIVFNSILCLYCFLAACFVGILLVLHTYLIKNGLTTTEYCRDTWDIFSGNPYRKSKAYKHFFKMFDYPAIVVSDPESKLKDRQKMQKLMESSGVNSKKVFSQQKSFGAVARSMDQKTSENVTDITKIQKEGITEQDIKVAIEQQHQQNSQK